MPTVVVQQETLWGIREHTVSDFYLYSNRTQDKMFDLTSVHFFNKSNILPVIRIKVMEMILISRQILDLLNKKLRIINNGLKIAQP